MKSILIRTAGLQDLPTLRAFEQGIISAERPFDKTLKPDPITYYDIGALINADDAEVIVAVLDEEIVGSAYAKIKPSLPYLKHDQHAYLGFMFVPPDHRGKGINKLIIEELARWAQSKNITELRLDVYDENHPAIRAYEKAGFTKYLVNMRKDISEG